MQALVLLVCSILALEVRFQLDIPAAHKNRNINQDYLGKHVKNTFLQNKPRQHNY
jgi:hypothetical protein